ncbi:MAG TPA: hypothetical protein VI980_00575 [Acidimicrobiia bacterium]|nr:hypothetical protein [Acidimicrobiia bacterium]
MTDELRNRLSRLDPMASDVPAEPVTTESSRQLLEDIMTTPTVEQPESGTLNKRPWLVAVAAVAVVIVAIGAVGLLARDGGGDPIAATPPLELNAGGEDPMAMCIAFSVEELAKMQTAFEGTVTSVDGNTVTLDVGTWFKGGDAGQVALNAPQGLEALIDGFPFEVGSQYLITAWEGNVNYCGFSAASTPEMRAAFEQAFGS